MAAPISYTKAATVQGNFADAVEDAEIELYGNAESMVRSDEGADSDSAIVDMFYQSSEHEAIVSTTNFSIAEFMKILGLPWIIYTWYLERRSCKAVPGHWKRFIVHYTNYVETGRKVEFYGQNVQFERSHIRENGDWLHEEYIA